MGMLTLTLLAAGSLMSLAAAIVAEGKSEKGARSEFFHAFDPPRMLEKYDKWRLGNSGSRGKGHDSGGLGVKRPDMPREWFKDFDFRIEGEVSDKEITTLLEGLQAELYELARQTGGVVAHKPKNIFDRPIWLLAVRSGSPWMDLRTLRGYYFTYEEGEIQGAAEIFAFRTNPEKPQWRVICQVHETDP